MAKAGGETTWKVSGLAVGPNRQSTGRGLMGTPSSACQTLRQHYLSLARMDGARATPFSQRQLSPFAGRDAADSGATCKGTRTEVSVGTFVMDRAIAPDQVARSRPLQRGPGIARSMW